MMTTDPRSLLENFYQNHIEKALEALEKNYECFDCVSNQDKILDTSEELIRKGIKVDIEGEPVEIIVGFPSTFPDALPKLYLSKKDFEQYYPLPHLQSNGFICTRDSDVVDINDSKAEEATLELIEVGIEDLRKNRGREFGEEFKEEFLAYWEDRAKYWVLFLAQTDDEVKVLARYSLEKKVYGTKTLISDSEEKVKQWADNLDIEYSNEGDGEVLFLPLKDIDLIPKTNAEIYKIFSSLSNDIKTAIRNFYNRSKDNTTIIFSLTYGGELFAGFVHKKWSREVFQGFRGNSVPWKVRLIRSRNTEIEKIKIVNIGRNRLLKRGGLDKLGKHKLANTLKIIGCGSVGSHLSMSLAKGGISNFTLIDPDNLKPENIHRHLCGFRYLVGNTNISKTEAVKDHIQNHLPNTKITIHQKNILQLLMEYEGFLTEGDFIIVATADRSVERRINYLVRQLNLGLNLIILWLEPYGIGGHLIYINPDDDGCYQCCYNESGHFIYSIAEAGQSFNKREAGCQSSFVPYSNVELEQFISLSTGVIFDVINGNIEASTIYSWYLNPSAFKAEGYSISDHWLTSDKFSSEHIRLKPNPKCLICSNE